MRSESNHDRGTIHPQPEVWGLLYPLYPNEINLRVSDLDMQSGQLQVAPDKKIQLSSAALSEIKEFLKSCPGQVYLLEGRCWKPVTCKWKRCVLESLKLRAGQENQ